MPKTPVSGGDLHFVNGAKRMKLSPVANESPTNNASANVSGSSAKGMSNNRGAERHLRFPYGTKVRKNHHTSSCAFNKFVELEFLQGDRK